ncbi:MAG: glycoside hydrolase family 13 protein [Clostridia bacterium]|nr:glycoside hydrolase family 13 protein [Clostridia bacterium]
MYNPLVNKRPYGATAVDKETTITFPLDAEMGIKRVFVVLRKVFGVGCENCDCLREDTYSSGEVGGAFEGGERPREIVHANGEFRFELPWRRNEDGQDIFAGAFSLHEYGVYNYRFEGEFADGSLAFFGRDYDGTALRGDWLPEWQLTVSKYDYKTPDWAKQGIIYQIFADRFAREGDVNFAKEGRLHADWYERPDIEEEGKEYRADDFFGGNLKGIISKLDYLKELGITLIYLSPIFKSGSNHRYDTGDYMKIDELLGDEEDFKKLIAEAKKRGIRIMLDGVFNHTGADSIYFNREGNYDSLGAYQSKESPYYSWYDFEEYPNKYNCWWGSTVVPTVNKSAKGYQQLVLGEGGVIDKWTKLGVAGWRFDVVDELPIDFTTALCGKVKSEGEDVLVVGEVWEDATTKISYEKWRPYFMGGQLDAVMNYPFKEAILKFATTGDRRAFVDSVTHILENYPKESLDCLMNLIDSHDTVRALTRLSGVEAPESKLARANFRLSDEKYALAKKRLMFASKLQYLLPGVPCVYYGDEAGVQGFEDPLNRATYPWGREDAELVAHYKKLAKTRKKYEDFMTGETVFLPDDQLVVFERRARGQRITIYANANPYPVKRKVQGYSMSKNQLVNAITVEPYSIKVVKD